VYDGDIDQAFQSVMMSSMPPESLYINERIGRPADEVYEYAVDPKNLPQWAPGLASAVENVDGQWFVETPIGRAGFAFVERNPYGVLDHEVTLPSGEVIVNPMRVVRYGNGCEAVFTLRRLPGMSDEEFERDTKAVAGDLARLKKIVEGRKPA
jgi:hypothetical protein